MTFAPATLKTLAAYWVAQGGVNLGIVGDTAHATKGTSYHLGKDQLLSTAYSIRTARDKAGLTNAASAFDMGRLDGSLTKLWAFSAWFTKQCMEKRTEYRDVREVIFWHPGRGRVVGWSSLNPTTLINDYGDLSHKTHTHISFYRDSEFRQKTKLFIPYFGTTTTEIAMPTLTSYIPGQIATIKPTANVRTGPKLTASIIRVVDSTPDKWVVVGWCKGDVDPEGGSDLWLIRWANGRWEYTAKSNVSAGPAAPTTVVDDGYTKATQDAAVAAQKAADQAAIDAAKAAAAKSAAEVAGAAAAERERIAQAAGNAEANKIRNT